MKNSVEEILLPSALFSSCAKILSNRDLLTEKAKVRRYIMAIEDNRSPIHNDTQIDLWRRFKGRLAFLGSLYSQECAFRGLVDNTNTYAFFRERFNFQEDNPGWMGLPSVHARHRSILMQRDPEFYGDKFWKRALPAITQ